jgi:hypothetical protein
MKSQQVTIKSPCDPIQCHQILFKSMKIPGNLQNPPNSRWNHPKIPSKVTPPTPNAAPTGCAKVPLGSQVQRRVALLVWQLHIWLGLHQEPRHLSCDHRMGIAMPARMGMRTGWNPEKSNGWMWNHSWVMVEMGQPLRFLTVTFQDRDGMRLNH